MTPTFWNDGYTVDRGAFQPWQYYQLGDEHISMPHRTEMAVWDLMRNPRIVNTVKALIGPEVSGLGSNYYPRSPEMGWHKDNEFILARPESLVSAWIPLQGVEDYQALEVIPLSHLNRLEYGALQGVRVPMKAGDILYMHGDLTHRSGLGLGERPSLLFTYIKKGWPFRPGRTEQRTEVDIA